MYNPLDMKSAFSLFLGLLGSATAEPIAWVGASPRSLFSRAEGGSTLASRSISSDPASFANVAYDYLVVGGGTAGLAVAARLSESGEYTVGVLEAGISGLGAPIIDIPGDFGADVGTVYDCTFFKFVVILKVYPKLNFTQGITQQFLALVLTSACPQFPGHEER